MSQENNPIWGCEGEEKQAEVCGLRPIFFFFFFFSGKHEKAHRDLKSVTGCRPRPGLREASPVATEPESGWADREHTHNHLLSWL